MPEYIELDLTADPEQLTQDARDFITEQTPEGYVLDPFVDWILSAVARMAVEVIVITGRVPMTIFQTFGERVLKIPVLGATTATSTVTVAATDDLGHILGAGAQIDVDGVGFVTTEDLTIPPLATSGQVAIAAIEPGAAGSALTGADVSLVAPTYVWVDSITLDAITIGGRDGETGEEYVNRLADETPTLSAKAILIEDFEVLARRDLEVHRALALDNYVPEPPTSDVPGAVTVALQDAAGEPVSEAAELRVKTTLEAGRVLNLDVHVIAPTYTEIDVSFTAECHAGADPDIVEAEAEAAIAAFLSPATWGLPAAGDQLLWIDEPEVVRNDLIGQIYLVRGIRHVSALTLAIAGDALGTADLAIAGPAGLTRPGTITGTVTL